MRKLRRRILPVLAIALAVTTLTPQSANAQTVLLGDGTIAPGLTTVPTPQPNISFDGTTIGAFGNGGSGFVDVGVGVLDCTFRGASEIPEWDVQGRGHGVVNCVSNIAVGANTHAPGDVTPTVTITCANFHYDRVGPLFVTADHTNVPRGNHCDVTICFDHGCTTATVQTFGVAVFVPTSVQPVTSYQMQGVILALPWA